MFLKSPAVISTGLCAVCPFANEGLLGSAYYSLHVRRSNGGGVGTRLIGSAMPMTKIPWGFSRNVVMTNQITGFVIKLIMRNASIMTYIKFWRSIQYSRLKRG